MHISDSTIYDYNGVTTTVRAGDGLGKMVLTVILREETPPDPQSPVLPVLERFAELSYPPTEGQGDQTDFLITSYLFTN